MVVEVDSRTGKIRLWETAPGGARRLAEHAGEFYADAFGADIAQQRGLGAHGGRGGGIHPEPEHGGEAYGAQQAQMVLHEPRGRVADSAHDARRQVGTATDEVQDLAADRIAE